MLTGLRTVARNLRLAPLALLVLLGSCAGSVARDVPAEVDPALWAALTAELERQLELAGPRQASAASEPAQLEYDQSSATLSWYFTHPGDYNQDGVVTISDLTPLGVNMNATALALFGTAQFPHHSILSAVDGDGNGVINISDITPLAANFGHALSGYRVYLSATEADYPLPPTAPNGAGAQLVDTVGLELATAAAGNRKRFTVQVVPTTITQLFWVRPVDAGGEGAASNTVSIKALGNAAPKAQLSAPESGATPAKISFDASHSTDADGAIVNYQWDFDGDGEYEYDSGSQSVVDFYYYSPGQFTTTVRVTDDGGAAAEAAVQLEIVAAAEWRLSSVAS